ENYLMNVNKDFLIHLADKTQEDLVVHLANKTKDNFVNVNAGITGKRSKIGVLEVEDGDIWYNKVLYWITFSFLALFVMLVSEGFIPVVTILFFISVASLFLINLSHL